MTEQKKIPFLEYTGTKEDLSVHFNSGEIPAVGAKLEIVLEEKTEEASGKIVLKLVLKEKTIEHSAFVALGQHSTGLISMR